jgi:hypothetical protein
VRFSLCIQAWRRPGPAVRVIIIVLTTAAAARFAPVTVLPLAGGIALGNWLQLSLPTLAVA